MGHRVSRLIEDETGAAPSIVPRAAVAPPADRGAPDALPARAAWTRQVEPVFLVGCARSGTTWLQSLLATHPQVHSGPETHFFASFHPVELEFWRAKDRRLGLSAYLAPAAFFALVGDTFWRVVSALPEPETPPRCFLEKSPHHCLSARFILHTFPRARFLHLVRDPRAVVASLLRVSRSWGQSWAPAELTEAARMWRERVRASRRIQRLVERPEQFLELRYEDLRADPRAHLDRLFAWLGLPAGAALIDAAIRANSLDQVRSSPHPFGSIALPRAAGPSDSRADLQEAYPRDFVGAAPCRIEEIAMDAADRRRVERLAGDLLREYGYDRAEGDLPGSPEERGAHTVFPTITETPVSGHGGDGAGRISRDGCRSACLPAGSVPAVPPGGLRDTPDASEAALRDPSDVRENWDLWLATAAGRATVAAGRLPALAEAGPPPDREASVLMVGEGDDPEELLRTLAGMAEHWQEDWELVLVSRSGTACEATARHLEGDFRLVRNPEPVPADLALDQAALAARGRDLILLTPTGPFRTPRDRFLHSREGVRGQGSTNE